MIDFQINNRIEWKIILAEGLSEPRDSEPAEAAF